jgi:hypothetical protein
MAYVWGLDVRCRLPGWNVADFRTPHKRRMSDGPLLAWTVVAIVVALVVGFFVIVWSICLREGRPARDGKGDRGPPESPTIEGRAARDEAQGCTGAPS